MLRSALAWFGFAQPVGVSDAAGGHAHGHDHGGKHGHTHGVVDPTIATTDRGIWAIKWSFIILAITAALQLAVVLASGSVALLADTIHNVGDAVTAIPLWIAFRLVRRRPTLRFTYGLGRVEDLAGVAVVAIILFSAIVAAYEAIERLIHPQAITLLWAVAVAGIIGFIGNEAVAVFRIRAGREIDSATLIADGYHARTDGLTSLAVVVGAAGVWIGFPLADPIVGLIITAAIFGIVWQSAKAVFTRLLDGVEPGIVGEIRHAAEHVPAVRSVLAVRARWLGHRLTTNIDVAVSGDITVAEAESVATAVEGELLEHIPALSLAHVRVRPEGVTAIAGTAARPGHGEHHHAPLPVTIRGDLAVGTLEIVDTADGERMQLTYDRLAAGADVTVIIDRPGGAAETLTLEPLAGTPTRLVSRQTPAEPHEFAARLRTRAANGRTEDLAFRMTEPVGHIH